MQFSRKGNTLQAEREGETLILRPWGRDALRVTAYRHRPEQIRDLSLTEEVPEIKPEITISERTCTAKDEKGRVVPYAQIRNGKISAEINHAGVITYYRDGKKILQEYYRFYDGTISKESRCLKYVSREWKSIQGSSQYRLTVMFEAEENEKIFGMGEYQDPYLDRKGCEMNLDQRNSQACVPFLISSRGYGFLWNCPSVGSVSFGKTRTRWSAESTDVMDYWITAGDTPKEILRNYTDVTGHAPMFPEDRMGLWQCKLRYRTQEEVLSVARRCKKEGIPLDVIIIDFFHWTLQGEWKFDPVYWPDPKKMTEELHAMGTSVLVSVWPSVDRRSENFDTLKERGLLVETERGNDQLYEFCGDCGILDVSNPAAREFLWDKCRKNYLDLGIDGFWLDNTEPDLNHFDFDNIRYAAGSGLSCTNLYPQWYSRTFAEPMEKAFGRGHVANLVRCAFAGSQKYANVVWSGDVPSTFEAFRDQVQAGLSMGLAGIPWWTTDIGGFMTDDVEDPQFRELLVRWFQFAVFCPVLRMHGDRGPHTIPAFTDGSRGGGFMTSGQPNELWSFGGEVYRILKKYLGIRLSMHDYIRDLFREASENGSPLMRTMFYEFPDDPDCWACEDQYMFGSRFLVAPVFHYGQTRREVYLPDGRWKDTRDGRVYEGGRTLCAEAPLDAMPVFEKL